MGELTWQAAAAANILEARKKKGRIATKKSRSGCSTCKARRIKCDETHPECVNCTKNGRKCGGYVTSPPNSSGKNSNSLIGQQLSQTLGLNENEIRTFDYFLSWTAPRLAGPLDKDFWCGQVLQVAQSEPIVLDALLAFSILYEHPQFMKSFYPPGAPENSTDAKYQNGIVNIAHPAFSKPPIDAFHATALMYYNRAMKRFRARTEEGTATPLLALLTCALFICNEIIRDNVFGALVLFTQGTKLLSEYQPTEIIGSVLYSNLKQMFARLGLLTALFGHSSRVDVHHELAGIDVEKGFDTLSNARVSLYALTTDAHDTIRDAAEFTNEPNTYLPKTNFVDDSPSQAVNSSETRVSPSSVRRLYYGCVDDQTVAPPLQVEEDAKLDQTSLVTIPWHRPSKEVLERRSSVQARLYHWNDAFAKSSCGQVEDEAATSLWMHYHVFAIWIDVCLSPFESSFDQFKPQFEEILRLADIFTRRKTECPTFTLEAGVMPQLYFVATKCRVPSLRRRAIDLMRKAPLKESMHGSRSVAEFVSRIVSIEEEDLSLSPPSSACFRNANQTPPPDDSILPDESKRIQNFEILMNRPANRFEIRVTRYSYNASGERIKSIVDYPM